MNKLHTIIITIINFKVLFILRHMLTIPYAYIKSDAKLIVFDDYSYRSEKIYLPDFQFVFTILLLQGSKTLRH